MTVVPAENAHVAIDLGREAAERRLEATREKGLSMLSVRYGQTVNTGNYSSVRLDAEAIVPMDSEPDSILEALTLWVRERLPLSDTEKIDQMYETRKLRKEIQDLERDAAAARAMHSRLLVWAAALNIPLPSQLNEDLPF